MSYRVLVKKAKQLGDIMSWCGGKARTVRDHGNLRFPAARDRDAENEALTG
jgi:hypothetical protein